MELKCRFACSNMAFGTFPLLIWSRERRFVEIATKKAYFARSQTRAVWKMSQRLVVLWRWMMRSSETCSKLILQRLSRIYNIKEVEIQTKNNRPPSLETWNSHLADKWVSRNPICSLMLAWNSIRRAAIHSQGEWSCSQNRSLSLTHWIMVN